jgi:hypothetical protein
MLATPYCPRSKSEIFVAGTEPTQVCPLHAGSGEPSPLLRELENAIQGPQAENPPNGQQPGPPQQQPQQPRKERGIRRLLRAIFGGQ